jgi:hypothetical protein
MSQNRQNPLLQYLFIGAASHILLWHCLDSFLSYLGHNNKCFHIQYTQMPLVSAWLSGHTRWQAHCFYSKKVNSTQSTYTIGEKELLITLEIPHKYHTRLQQCQDLR